MTLSLKVSMPSSKLWESCLITSLIKLPSLRCRQCHISPPRLRQLRFFPYLQTDSIRLFHTALKSDHHGLSICSCLVVVSCVEVRDPHVPCTVAVVISVVDYSTFVDPMRHLMSRRTPIDIRLEGYRLTGRQTLLLWAIVLMVCAVLETGNVS
ncbi:hypothetical protein EI94DRAFT_1752497 [Lactarius quietus]|nr:hypothetical protein EI94DRAFT_1752497 [Lactarius quietus]